MDAPPPERKRTKSDVIAHATVTEYVMSHTKPNGGFRGFLHSNLFAALLIWGLSQAVIIAGVVITFYMRTSQLAEWKGQTEGVLKRMDDSGTYHGHYADERQDKQIAVLETKVGRLEDDTKHLEVIESEHRRLTKDVEELRNGKK